MTWIAGSVEARGRHRPTGVGRHAVLSDEVERPPVRHEDAGLVTALATAYGLATWALPGLPAATNIYLAQPVLWLSLALVSWSTWRRVAGQVGDVRPVALAAVGAGAVHVLVVLVSGAVFGFGRSPHGTVGLATVGNLWFAVSAIVGIEATRAALFSIWRRRSEHGAFVAVTVMMALATIPAGRIAELTESVGPALQAVGGSILPALAQSMLATSLVAFGGPIASIVYRVLPAGLQWLSPVLPDVTWMVAGLVGTLAPLLALAMIGADTRRSAGHLRHDRGSWVSVTISMAMVFVIWLSAGLFGVRPVATLGSSMEPTFHQGDLILVAEVDAWNLSVGDIVVFTRAQEHVAHRIVEIARSDDGAVFVTQGDANNTPDEPLVAPQIEGRVVARVPWIGWIPIRLRQFVSWMLA